MKRNFHILLLLLLINVQASHAVIITGEGMTTEKGFLSWDNFYTMSDRLDSVEKIQKILILGTIVFASTFIYLKWCDNQNKLASQEIISDLDDIKN